MTINKLFTLLKNRDRKALEDGIAQHTLEIEQEITSLKSQGADINPQDPEIELTLLHIICMGFLNNNLLAHFEAHHIINTHTQTLLRVAADTSNSTAISWLLEKGQNINIQDDIGNTPLHAAVESGHLEVVKLLLENHADISLKNEREETALWQAFIPIDDTVSEEARVKIMELLIQYGSNVNALDDHGTSLIKQVTFDSFQEINNKCKALLLLLSAQDINIQLDDYLIFNYFSVQDNLNQLFAVEGYETQKIAAGCNLYKALTQFSINNQNQVTLNIAAHVLELVRNHIDEVKPYILIQDIKQSKNIYLLRDNELKYEKLKGLRLGDIEEDFLLYQDLTFLNDIERAADGTSKRITEIFIKDLKLPELPEEQLLLKELQTAANPQEKTLAIQKLQAPSMKEVFHEGDLMGLICSFSDPQSASNFSYTNKNSLETLIQFPDQETLGQHHSGHDEVS